MDKENYITNQRVEQKIEPVKYGAVLTPRSAMKYSPYPRHSASIEILRFTQETLLLTKGQLGALLGTSYGTIKQWFQGRRRPSSLFLARLCKLLLLRMNGLELVRARSIDWETGEIRWKNGAVSLVDHRHGWNRAKEAEHRLLDRESTHLPASWGKGRPDK